MADEDEEQKGEGGNVHHLSDARHARDEYDLRNRPFAPLDSEPASGGPEHPSDPRSPDYRPKQPDGRRRSSLPRATLEVRESPLVKRARSAEGSGDRRLEPTMSPQARHEMEMAGSQSAMIRRADIDRLPEAMRELYASVNEAVHRYDALRECMADESLTKELRNAPRISTERPRNKQGPHDTDTAWQWVRSRLGRQLHLFDEAADYRQPHETRKSGLAAWYKECGDRFTPPLSDAHGEPDYSAGFQPSFTLAFFPSVMDGLVNLDPVRLKGATQDGDAYLGLYDKLNEWLSAVRTKHSQGDLFGQDAPSPIAKTCERAMALTSSLQTLDADISTHVKEIKAIDARMQARKG